MTVARGDQASERQRAACGSYRSDGVEHMLVAIRECGGPWKLLDIACDATSVVESFYPDEELEAVQAVADLYLAERPA